MLEKIEEDKVKNAYLKKISIRHKQRIIFIDVKDIYWIEADNQYVNVHTQTDTYLLRSSLTALEERLNPRHFYRSHRSAIVNLDQIDYMQPYFKGDYFLFLKTGKKVNFPETGTKA